MAYPGYTLPITDHSLALLLYYSHFLSCEVSNLQESPDSDKLYKPENYIVQLPSNYTKATWQN